MLHHIQMLEYGYHNPPKLWQDPTQLDVVDDYWNLKHNKQLDNWNVWINLEPLMSGHKLWALLLATLSSTCQILFSSSFTLPISQKPNRFLVALLNTKAYFTQISQISLIQDQHNSRTCWRHLGYSLSGYLYIRCI